MAQGTLAAVGTWLVTGLVGYWYEDFTQTEDAEARSLLSTASGPIGASLAG